MGYRGFEAAGVAPLFPFGHGLSYGTIEWGTAKPSATEAAAGDSITVQVPVHNTGDRAGTVVVQGYVAAIDPPVVRPPKELKTFAKAHLNASTATVLELTFGPHAFRRWDDKADQWTIDPGRYELVVAASATDERQRIAVVIT